MCFIPSSFITIITRSMAWPPSCRPQLPPVIVIGAIALHLPVSVRHVATPFPWLPPKPTAIFTMEGTTAIHFASLIILSGMPLSGVAMISSSTFAELSILFSMSDWSLSLSALQPVPASSATVKRAKKALANGRERRFMSGSGNLLTEWAYVDTKQIWKCPLSGACCNQAKNMPEQLPLLCGKGLLSGQNDHARWARDRVWRPRGLTARCRGHREHKEFPGGLPDGIEMVVVVPKDLINLVCGQQSCVRRDRICAIEVQDLQALCSCDCQKVARARHCNCPHKAGGD